MAASHFAVTPQSDVVRICAHDFQRHGNAFGTTESACSRAFIILRSHFHLHDCSERTLTEIVSKITPKPWTCPLNAPEALKLHTNVFLLYYYDIHCVHCYKHPHLT